jgi:2'-5' RNA ligase
MLRLFVAVNLSPDALGACGLELRRVELALGPHARAVRFPRSEGLHFTIKFLGWTPEETLEPIRAGLAQAAAEVPPFEVVLAGLEAFPSIKRPRVLFLGVSAGGEPMRELAARVEERLAPLGFPADRRGFTPHLTLGRVKEPRLAARVGERFAAIPAQEVARFRVDQLFLMQSELSPGGSRYGTRGAFALGAQAP